MQAMKKTLSLFLAVCSICMLQPITVFADTKPIMVNGTNILLEQDYTLTCGNGTAKFDPGTKTLTLDNATINAGTAGDTLTYGIEIHEQGVVVELVGQNSIDAHFGIWGDSSFQIKGTGGGSLSIHANQASELGSISRCGIRIDDGGLDVRDASLQITFDDLHQDVSAYAIYICGGENQISNSRIEINMPTSSGEYAQSTGINATGAASLTISGNSTVTINTVDAGIAVGGGTLKISGSELAIPAAEHYAVSCGNLEIVDDSDVNVHAERGLALSANEKITISNSTVSTESINSNGLSCTDLAVTDASNLTAKGYWPAFYVMKDTIIKDSSVTAESAADVGVYCPNGNLEISASELTCTSAPQFSGILVGTGNLTMTDSTVVSPGDLGVPGIRANGDIVISGGTTEVGDGGISSGNNVQVGGTITANGLPSYDNISSNNTNGQVSFSDADYGAVDAAIARANALDKGGYTNFDEVEAAIGAVIRGKDLREQDVVDGYAAAIESAIAALKPLPAISILEGADQTIATDTDTDVAIRVDGNLDKFVSVLVDGTELSKEHYIATPGSTIITFKPEYIKTLAVGDHTVAIRFTDGQALTTLTIKENETEQPGETPENPDENPGGLDEKPEQPGQTPENPDENPGGSDENPEQPGEPDKNPEQPVQKPEQPSNKPDNPDATPGDDSSNGQPQKPSDGSSNETTQKPSNVPAQNQSNDKLPPKTGDYAPIGWPAILMVISAAWLITGRRRTGLYH